MKSGVTIDEVIKWGGPEVFNQGLALVNSGAVTECSYNDDTLEIRGKIEQPDGWEMPTGIRLEAGGRVRSLCPCYLNQKLYQICPHVTALGIYQATREAEVEVKSKSEKVKRAENNSSSSAADSYPSEPEYCEVPMKPLMIANLSGSRAALSIELDARYGNHFKGETEIDLPAGSLQDERVVYMEDPKDPDIRYVRNLKVEREAMKTPLEWGFHIETQNGYPKFFLVDPKKVLDFLGAGIPALRRLGWRIELSPKLEALTDSMPWVLSNVTVKDAPNGDFDVKYDFTVSYEPDEAHPEGREVHIDPVLVQAAINRGDGFIKQDGAVVLLDTHSVEEMHGVFDDCAASQGGAEPGWFRVKRVHAPYVKSSLEAYDSFVVDDDRAEKWRAEAAERNRERGEAKFEPVALGPLEKTLRPYQKQGVYWMRFLENASLSGLLADEMGLGKTLQTLTWISLGRTGAGSGEKLPAIVVAPTSLVRNWEAEAKKFVPSLKTLVVSGPDRARAFAAIPKADLVITSYALLQRDFDEAYAGVRFSAAVIDEAQHIKNRGTRNAKTVKMIDAERRLALSGTPVENSVADVWSIFDFLMPGYLGDYETFRTGYEMPIADGGSAGGYAQEKLKRKLHPFILRRLKTTVAKDLPPKIISVSLCPIAEDAQREYVAVLQKTRSEVRAMVKEKGLAKSKFEILARLMKLRQIAAAGKLDAFLEQLETAIGEGHRVLVFSQFVKMLQLIASALQERGIRFSYLDGQTKDRLGECNRFNRDRAIPVFLISLMAGGTGLNLTGADMVIHYDPWWNPAVEDQATDRAHRIGQVKNVYVIKMIASGTVEEKVLELQRRKQAVIAATVSTTDNAVMEKLTGEDLASLLT